GWGTIHFGGPVSNVLQEVVIPVWNQAECVAAYKENNVTDTMMCAGLKGDSGGPYLTQIFPDTKWYIAGVVSWGIECASPNRPGVYTRVNKYLDWIKENSV
ncbi:UNVERIFIED_CONTAM: hypothetical protein GTU68_044341, partial [Idotea baltica]|nr:hypothetical protein [Idotea baltica]